MIAHRLSTLDMVDEVIVFDHATSSSTATTTSWSTTGTAAPATPRTGAGGGEQTVAAAAGGDGVTFEGTSEDPSLHHVEADVS